jgi:hypothetical protein
LQRDFITDDFLGVEGAESVNVVKTDSAETNSGFLDLVGHYRCNSAVSNYLTESSEG